MTKGRYHMSTKDWFDSRRKARSAWRASMDADGTRRRTRWYGLVLGAMRWVLVGCAAVILMIITVINVVPSMGLFIVGACGFSNGDSGLVADVYLLIPMGFAVVSLALFELWLLVRLDCWLQGVCDRLRVAHVAYLDTVAAETPSKPTTSKAPASKQAGGRRRLRTV